MPSDALHYMYAAEELNNILCGGRIEKITMPERDEIVLTVRNAGKSHCLLLSASSALPRCHLTTHRLTNPAVAPAFLMHLRKHIGAGLITAVTQTPYERVITVCIESKNELALAEKKQLVCELTGKYANIVLVDGDGKISDCIKRITPDASSKRQLLPGLRYVPIPPQNKINVTHEEELSVRLRTFNGGKIDGFILSFLSGLAPISVSEAVYRALGYTAIDTLTEETVSSVVRALRNLYDPTRLEPCIITAGGRYVDFGFMPYLTQGDTFIHFPSLNEAMDEFFYGVDREKRLCKRAHVLETAVKNAIARCDKKLELFYRKKSECLDCEKDKLYGELLTANLYRIRMPAKQFVAENYYTDPPESIVIPLDDGKSAQHNAQVYYRRYTKKKKTLAALAEQIEQAETNREYYASIREHFRVIDSPEQLDDVVVELVEAGLIPSSQTKSGSKGKTSPSPLTRYECAGYAIYVGKNNLQNDRITKQAAPQDVWLHAQKIPGSHVVIVNPTDALPPQEVLVRAATLAATNSKAHLSSNVPVDYTFIRHVSKPKGAPHGKVVYTNQRTIYVNP